MRSTPFAFGLLAFTLVIALHSGEGDSGYLDFEAFRAPGARTLQQLAEETQFLIAAPNGERGFTGARGERDVLDLIARLQAVYALEPRQTFMMGWSLGGAAVWRFAMKYPDRIGAMASVTGAAEWLNEQNARSAASLPVLHCQPQQDQLSERARRTTAQATTLLRKFTARTYPGTGHLDIWPRALPDVFAFFVAQLGPEPKVGNTRPSDTEVNP